MSAATLVDTIDASRVRQLMVERNIDVAALAAAAGLTEKTIYTVLHGLPVSLATAGKIYRALGGDRGGFFTSASHRATPALVPA
ncbi:MAG: helix-turn-helix domain-containing protein [Candidatus Dormibacteria bacterium]